ncbi:MAG: hypothetical protein M3Y41_07135, partial [Pseudomonadota bacterium]|nr:hypothetical protein [Pseudomonadota bacterium]
GAPRLLLVKHCSVPPGAAIDQLAEAGMLDRAFPGLLAGFRGELWVAGPEDCPAPPLDPGALPGRRLG